jgi:hypothetical protein
METETWYLASLKNKAIIARSWFGVIVTFGGLDRTFAKGATTKLKICVRTDCSIQTS